MSIENLIREQHFTLIGEEIKIQGDISLKGNIRLSGSIHGQVKCEQSSHLTIERNGLIDGNIVADTVEIFGQFKGQIKAKQIIIRSSGRVQGTIKADTCSIYPGSEVVLECEVGKL